jgi:hypothetical protein
MSRQQSINSNNTGINSHDHSRLGSINASTEDVDSESHRRDRGRQSSFPVRRPAHHELERSDGRGSFGSVGVGAGLGMTRQSGQGLGDYGVWMGSSSGKSAAVMA